MFWTLSQTHAYLNCAEQGPVSIDIDASGQIIDRIRLANGSLSGPIYLYLIVVNTAAGQISVCQMVSERHTAAAITKWLITWVCLAGIPHPKEITCDASIALLTAAVKVFTPNETIEEYVQSYQYGLPPCYIQIDVAHFMKIYAEFWKKTDKPRKVRTFYKAAIGQLIQARKEEDTIRILKAIFTIAHSETDGPILKSKLNTQCEESKQFLLSLIDPKNLEIEEEIEEARCFPKPEGDVSLLDVESVVEGITNPKSWLSLGTNWNKEAIEIAQNEVGEHVSAYFLPTLAEKLLKHVKWIPLWSNVYRDCYGYGKLPASSAAVECEFKNVKGKFCDGMPTDMRPDAFIGPYANLYLKGRANIFIAKAIEIDQLAQNERSLVSLEMTMDTSSNLNYYAGKNTLEESSLEMSTIENCSLEDSALETCLLKNTTPDVNHLETNLVEKYLSKIQDEVMECNNWKILMETDELESKSNELKHFFHTAEHVDKLKTAEKLKVSKYIINNY